MAQKYQVKYGILYKPTGEYIGWLDGDTAKLFDTDKETVNNAMIDLINFDGGYDSDPDDFVVDTLTLPESFDGSNLISEDSVFVNKQTIFNSL